MKTKFKFHEIQINNISLFALTVLAALPYASAYLLMNTGRSIYAESTLELFISAIFLMLPVLCWWLAFSLSGKMLYNFTYNLYHVNESVNAKENIWAFNIKAGSIAAAFFGFTILILSYTLGYSLKSFFIINVCITAAWLVVTSMQYYYFSRMLVNDNTEVESLMAS